ncbi:hypothetical protein E2C01_070257 [Portunus trituberculatus]|uniref:Uncharacterized protein n=1 Tax=Portunus trituberculatus TaxID=210409 RepID=A0A5B7HTQ0_PORTR|nr:hypothetical protein [Portunus trituberculatus]
MPPPFSSTSPQLSAILQEMLLQGVLEKYSGPVFLSCPFLVPRQDRQDPRLVVNLSALNAHIECHHFRMVTLKQSRLEPTQDLQWLGMWWDTRTSTIHLSEDNRRRVLQQVRRASWSTTFTHRIWTRLMGSLTFAAQVTPWGLCGAGGSSGKATGCFHGRPRTVCARFHHTFTGCCVSGCLRAFWRPRFLEGCQRRSSKSTQTLRAAVGASRHLTVDRAGDTGSRLTHRGTST